jgi:hypothetical protein
MNLASDNPFQYNLAFSERRDLREAVDGLSVGQASLATGLPMSRDLSTGRLRAAPANPADSDARNGASVPAQPTVTLNPSMLPGRRRTSGAATGGRGRAKRKTSLIARFVRWPCHLTRRAGYLVLSCARPNASLVEYGFGVTRDGGWRIGSRFVIGN